TEKLSTATGKVASDTEKAAKDGGGTDEEMPAGGGALPSLGGDAIGDWLGVSDEEIDQMWGEICGAFKEGFEDIAGDDLARAKENWGSLKTQLDCIGKSKPFKELQHIVGNIFGTAEDSLWGETSGAFKEGCEDIAGDDLARAKENWVSLKTQLDRIGKSKPFKELQHIVGNIFGAGEDSLWGKIESFGNSVSPFFSETLPGY